jgi:hypothetical protein
VKVFVLSITIESRQRYFQCLLHCPDGLLQTLLTEYLCHYITLHPNLWDRLKDSLRNFETFVNVRHVKASH